MTKQEFIQAAVSMQSSYSMSDQAKKKLANIELVAIIGPTGVGKTTIIHELGLPHVASDVTRPIRPHEKKSQKEYNFRDDYEEMHKQLKNGEFAQFVVSNFGDFYGTHIDSYPDSGKCTIAVFAQALSSFEIMGFKSITAFYIMPPSYIEWMRRIGGDRSTQILERIDEARQSITSAMNNQETYLFILNDTIENALRDIRMVLEGGSVSQHRIQLALGSADIILERIGGTDLFDEVSI